MATATIDEVHSKSGVPVSQHAAKTLPMKRVLRAYLLQVRFELINALRTPAFAIPFLAIPVVVYLLFGVLMFDPEQAGATGTAEGSSQLASYLFSGFSVMAVMMPAFFHGCMGVALERDGGLLKLRRAMPVPTGADLIAKIVTSMIVAAIALCMMLLAAFTISDVTLTFSQAIVMQGAILVGSVPLFAIGYFIGSLASGSAAPAYANLIFLPMMWLSGLFIPLPEFMQPWTVIWPAFHVNQLGLSAAGLEQFVFVPPALAAGVLIGVTVLFGGLGIWRVARGE